MTRFIVLDSGPLGLLFQRAGVAPAEACRFWARQQLASGVRIFVPEIIHYEIRRELLRLADNNALRSLERFIFAAPDRFVCLRSQDLRLAAELWAQSRNRGMPTASSQALDIDVILAAQVRNLNLPMADLVVATTNTKHLSRFVPCAEWSAI